MKYAIFLLLTLLLVACAKEDASPTPLPIVTDPTTATVTGTVQFEDLQYDSSGLTGTSNFKAVRQAIIDLVDENNQLVATTSSDDSGMYSISGVGSGLYIRVLAQSGNNAVYTTSIRNHAGDVYAVSKSLPASSGDMSADVNIVLSNVVNGAFNILDALNSAGNFIASLSTMSLPDLSIFWADGTTLPGSYYCFINIALNDPACPLGVGIYITGGGGATNDKDQFDDDILWHEFSHFLEDSLNITDSPGGPHDITQNDLDLRLAWSEGWGAFFQIAVKNWLNSTDPGLLSTPDLNYYVDTTGNLSSQSAIIAINLDDPGLCGIEDCFIYSSNEIAIAKILTKLQQGYGINPLWTVYEQHLGTIITQFVNLDSFWDGWIAHTSPDALQLSDMNVIFGERQVYYTQDSFESAGDNTINTARLFTSSEQHYLYSDTIASDIDMVRFNASSGVSYTIETFDLFNGANTEIFVLDNAGSPVPDTTGADLSNDNRNDSCGLCINDKLSYSSLLQFTPVISGTYYVKVVTPMIPVPGVSRYGGYSLQITVN